MLRGGLTVRVLSRLRLVDESDVAAGRQQIRQLAALHGMPHPSVEALVTAASEILRNVIVHAQRGELTLGVTEGEDRAALVVVVRDDGPGIADLERALRDGYSTGGGLGLGLPSARRLVDVFELASSERGGTCVTLTQWLPDRARP
jgi:serine/threonine-protein kinase RsbT